MPNGTDTIAASYSIDGGLPQARSVPSNTGCAIPLDPFFSLDGLEEGDHNITITTVQMGHRPYMFNFFALDPKVTSSGRNVKKPNAGEITGCVVAGIIICIILCFSIIAFMRRAAWLRKKQTNSSDVENPDRADAKN